MPKNYHTIIVQDNNNSVNKKMSGLIEKAAQNGSNSLRQSTELDHEIGPQESRYNHQRESKVATKLLNPNFEHLKSSELDKEMQYEPKFPRKSTFKTLTNKKYKGK